MTTPAPSARLPITRLASLLLGLLLLAGPAAAQVRGISYTLSPTGERIFFDDNAGLENAFLYGGELGFGFGQYVELQALYLFNNDLQTDFSKVGGISEALQTRLGEMDARSIGLQRYGGRLKVNFLNGAVVPFAALGAGILRFDADDLNSSRNIYLSAGAGLQFTVGNRYALRLGVGNFTYRYNLGATFFDDEDLEALGLAAENFEQVLVDNWSVRVGLQAYLGGRDLDAETPLDVALREQLSGGLRGLSLRIEPFGSRVNFNEALPFAGDQRMAGLFAGLNLGPYVGVRGFYWRGIEDGTLFDVAPIQAFGGEMRLRFEPAGLQTLTPFLSFGGGYLDFLSGYTAPGGIRPESKPFVLGGVGATLPLSESLFLNGAARSLLLSDAGVDNVHEPGDVYSSWMYSVGLNFSFGSAPDRTAGDFVRTEIEDVQAAARGREARLEAALARTEARLDSLLLLIDRTQQGDTLAMARLSRLARQQAQQPAAVTPPAAEPTPAQPEPQAAQEPRVVTLPVPEEGEIYIRFGDPGGVSIESLYGDRGYVLDTTRAAGVLPTPAATPQAAAAQPLSAEQIRQIVQQALTEQLTAVRQAAPPETARYDALQEQLEDRLDALEERLQLRLEREVAQLDRNPAQPTVVVPQTPTRPEPAEEAAEALELRPRTFDAEAVMPFVALTYGEPILYTFGARLDVATSFLRPFLLAPEFTVGFGSDNYAYHFSLNALYRTTFFEGFQPYAGLGAGMLGFNESPEGEPGVQLTLNVLLGTAFNFRSGRFFAEYATFDFFDYNRFAVGYRYFF